MSIINTISAGGGGGGATQNYTQVTLTANGWSNNQQTVAVNGVTANSVVYYQPTYESGFLFDIGNVMCIGQSSNSLTFKSNLNEGMVIDVLFYEPTSV